MRFPKWSTRIQTALVIVLFLGSLATVVFNAFQTLFSQRESEVRDRLSEASHRLAVAAEREVGPLLNAGNPRFAVRPG